MKRAIRLCGVKIVTEPKQDESCCLTQLSIVRGGKTLREIKGQHLKTATRYTGIDRVSLNGRSYGEVNVVFNRPVALVKNGCYTIETKTDTTNDISTIYVYIESLGPQSTSLTSQTSDKAGKDDKISRSFFGNCDKNCPQHVFGGQISELVFSG